MKIFVAGSTGVIGRLLLPKLVKAGHEVIGMTHSPERISLPIPDYQPGSNRWQRGASNVKARSEYGWVPFYPSWRSGFVRSLR